MKEATFGLLTIVGGLLGFSATAAAADCAPVPAGILRWWSGDKTSEDRITHSKGVFFPGGPLYFDGGFVRSSFLMAGDRSIDGGPLPEIGGLTAVTVCAWVLRSGNADSIIVDCSGPDSGPFNSLSLQAFTMQPIGRPFVPSFSVIGGAAYISGSESLPFGRWFHLAGTWRSSPPEIRLYVDGKEIVPGVKFNGDPGAVIAIRPKHADRAYLGGLNSQRLPGALDEVMIFGRALSDVEIQAIYEAGNSGVCRASVRVLPGEAELILGHELNLEAVGTVLDSDGLVNYRWFHEGQVISGATNRVLHLAETHLVDRGMYRVEVELENEFASSDASVKFADFSAEMVGGRIRLAINSTLGSTWRIEYSDSSSGSQWRESTTLRIEGVPHYVSEDQRTSTERYWRAVRLD